MTSRLMVRIFLALVAFAVLAGLPPVYMQVGGDEALLDEDFLLRGRPSRKRRVDHLIVQMRPGRDAIVQDALQRDPDRVGLGGAGPPGGRSAGDEDAHRPGGLDGIVPLDVPQAVGYDNPVA